MNCEVTGCVGCPLFDSTGSEYGTYCHHPKRPFSVTVAVRGDEKIDGSCIKHIEVLDSEKEFYEKEAKRRSLLPRREKEKEPWMSIKIDNEPILDDDNFNPITPEWCPLNKEPITIIKK